jgi:hypothetical protein
MHPDPKTLTINNTLSLTAANCIASEQDVVVFPTPPLPPVVAIAIAHFEKMIIQSNPIQSTQVRKFPIPQTCKTRQHAHKTLTVLSRSALVSSSGMGGTRGGRLTAEYPFE